LSSRKKKNFNKAGLTVKDIAQRGCEISIPGDTRDSTGHSPEQYDATSKLALLRLGRSDQITTRPC